MDKLHLGLAVVCIVAGVAGLKALSNAGAWEHRAHAAEHAAAGIQQQVDSLEHVAAVAEVNAVHMDTVRVTLTKLIAVTDSSSHPDSSCGPSLRARDKALAAAKDETLQWQLAFHAQIAALSKLTAEKDTLRDALAARPHAGVTLELLHPRLHLSLQAMVYPRPAIGVGLSYDLASIRL